jgi:hypothetical protein
MTTSPAVERLCQLKGHIEYAGGDLLHLVCWRSRDGHKACGFRRALGNSPTLAEVADAEVVHRYGYDRQSTEDVIGGDS